MAAKKMTGGKTPPKRTDTNGRSGMGATAKKKSAVKAAAFSTAPGKEVAKAARDLGVMGGVLAKEFVTGLPTAAKAPARYGPDFAKEIGKMAASTVRTAAKSTPGVAAARYVAGKKKAASSSKNAGKRPAPKKS